MALFQSVGTEALPWCEFAKLVQHLPPESALARAELGDKAAWGIGEQLLARAVHLLHVGIYQQADPKKRGPAPKPIETPWDRRDMTQITKRLMDLREREQRRKEGGGVVGD